MNFQQFLKYDTEDFILNDDFLKWVLHPDKEGDQMWNEFLSDYPDKKDQVQETVLILKALQPVEPEIPLKRFDLTDKISPGYSFRRRIGFMVLKVAAVIFIMLSIGVLIYYFGEKRQFPFEIASMDSFQKGKLILADGTVREFETEETRILQTNTGEIIVNSETVTHDVAKLKADKIAMNQVIIPYGKRSEITLADGTKIWLNSGSQLSYPAVFATDSREVYLSGEAFFDVRTDNGKPFYVITKDLKLRVLGTSFNVTSYEDDQETHAVLLTGKIAAGRNKKLAKTMEMIPGERVVFNKSDETILKEKVNVDLYSSWINGYLIFHSESMGEIFRKLERFYNRRILMEKSLDNVTFSGKLDLSDNIEKVLENISFSVPFSVISENDYYTIKP